MPCEYGFVYTRGKSAFQQVRKVLATIAEDVKQDGTEALPAGLVLVVDVKEKYPLEIARLIEIQKKKDPNDPEGKLKAFTEAEKQCRELGLDMGTILSLVPIPIQTSALHEAIEGFPAEVGQQIEWCAVFPTDACIKSSFKKLMDAGMKKAKPSLLERATMTAMMPLIERKAMAAMTKGRQAALYELPLETRKNLTPEQRKAKAEAYKEKLGLNKAMDPNAPEEK